MSLFSSILAKLGIGSADAAAPAAKTEAINTVDVVAKLEGMWPRRTPRS